MRALLIRAATAPLLLALAAGSGCAINPVTGWPEVVLMSKRTEQQLGDQAAAQIEQEMGFVRDEAFAGYVEKIGGRLAEQSPRRDVTYSFALVDSPIVNAFALPGGYVYVTSGLVAFANSEDELANVIGHEIGHVAARHAVQRFTRQVPIAVLTGIPTAVVGLVWPGLGRRMGAVFELGNSVVMAPYGRGQETEADEVGQVLAAASGWDPAAMSSFMTTLERKEGLDAGAKRSSAFLRTHPRSKDRASRTAQRARDLERGPGRPIAATRAEFLARIEGLLVGENPAEGVFRGPWFLHPDLGLALQFPDGWTTVNAPGFVAAQAPGEDAVIVLEVAARGSDPLGSARAFARERGARFDLLPKATQISGRDAARAFGTHRDAALDATWIAYGGRIYQLVGLCKKRSYEDYQTFFIDVALSLRALQPEERSGIREGRLRVVEAREGESLTALVARAGSAWSVEETAVANAIEVGDALKPGQLVKLRVDEPYRSPASASPDGRAQRPRSESALGERSSGSSTR